MDYFKTFNLIVMFALFAIATNAITETFTASATVGNQGPVVSVDSGQTISGTINQTIDVYVFFNASDQNGNGDLNDSSGQIILTTSGDTSMTSTTCVLNNTIDVNTKRYNCTISLAYYKQPGQWTINATISDDQANKSENSTVNLSNGDLDAVDVLKGSLSFSGSPGTSDIAPSEEPQRLENIGNQNYASINVTGFEFVSGSDVIGVGNVTVNGTDTNGPGNLLVNNTEVAIENSTLNRGLSSNRSIYFWLDIPASQPPGNYNAASNWVLEAII